MIMADVTLDCGDLLSSTCIPNIFIDKYMTNANGEFVKIYLYLLRCMDQSRKTCTISELADVFEHTEKDILRSLLYWEKMHLLQVEYDGNHEVSRISLKLPAADSASAVITPAESVSAPAVSGDYSPDQLDEFGKNEGIREVLFITENYLGRTLCSTDIQTILYWYDGLHFSTELIEYLIEICVSNGHTSLRYMDKVALSWKEANISSVEEAKQESRMHHKNVYAVMKAFGISGRNLISSELQTIQKWTGSYALSMDIIKEACRRTIQATGKPSFEYADTILCNWHRQDVHTLNDVLKLDAERRKFRSASKTADSSKRSCAANRFNNFPQRTYNYEQLEKQLLNTTN